MEFHGGYQAYSESGIDLTLLREQLKRTVTERWENNARVAAAQEELRGSAKRTAHPAGTDRRPG
jgi:Flp pilus assembly protein TadB